MQASYSSYYKQGEVQLCIGADLRSRLQNQTPLDIIFKFCSVKSFCLRVTIYNENRMFIVRGEASVLKILAVRDTKCNSQLRHRYHTLRLLEPFKCVSIMNAQERSL